MVQKFFNLFCISLFGFLLLLAGCSTKEKKDPTAGWSAEKIYQRAKSEFSAGDYEKAIEYYELLEARYPYGQYAQQAQIEAAYTYYKQNEPEQAGAAIDRFIKMYPNHPDLDYAYYLKGLIYFTEDTAITSYVFTLDLSDRDPKAARESFNNFKILVERFPDSKYAEDAMFRMRYLRNMIALYETHVARYYFNRRAYLAAANRAQAAIQNYPDTPAVEEALFILTESYGKLGLADLKEDAIKVYQKNYPDSPYARGENPNKKPWWKIWE